MSNKALQERKTKIDTRNAQEELMEIIRHKFLDKPHLTYEEQQKWKNLVDDSLLSKGNWKKVVYVLPNPEDYEYIRKINFGHLKNVLMQMVVKDRATIKDKEYFWIEHLNVYIKIDLRHFWKALYRDVVEVTSIALDEAVHMSAESPKKTKRTSYTWNAEE